MQQQYHPDSCQFISTGSSPDPPISTTPRLVNHLWQFELLWKKTSCGQKNARNMAQYWAESLIFFGGCIVFFWNDFGGNFLGGIMGHTFKYFANFAWFRSFGGCFFFSILYHLIGAFMPSTGPCCRALAIPQDCQHCAPDTRDCVGKTWGGQQFWCSKNLPSSRDYASSTAA